MALQNTSRQLEDKFIAMTAAKNKAVEALKYTLSHEVRDEQLSGLRALITELEEVK